MDIPPQRDDLTQPLAEAQIGMALNGIAVQLASLRKIGASPEQCREVYSRLLVEMANAAEIDMYGKTFVDPAKAAPKEVSLISELLETTPTTYRNKLFLSAYERFSVGSGTLIVRQDAQGQDHVLLVRGAKNPNEWGLPAGFMDPVPSNTATLPDRLDPEARSIQEEALAIHKKIDMPEIKATPGETLPVTALPSSDATRKAFRDEYRRLLKDEGWQAAYDKMNDGDYLRAVFEKAGIPLPKQPAGGSDFDATRKDNIRREAKEETGLDLKALERKGGAKISEVSTELGLGMASRGHRPNAIDALFLVDMGAGALPPLKPEDKEIVEAAWVPLSAIERGSYTVRREGRDTLPINMIAIPYVEKALNKLLDQRIREASGGRVESIDGVLAQGASLQGQAALGEDTLAGLYVQKISSIPASQRRLSLVGAEGQLAMQGYVEMAGVLGQAQDMPALVVPERSLPAPTPWVDKITQVIMDTAVRQPGIR